jgi:hypothetical protein
MYGETNLADVSGSNIQRYTINLMKVLFSDEEMMRFQISPVKQRGREAAPRDKSILLKGNVTE